MNQPNNVSVAFVVGGFYRAVNIGHTTQLVKWVRYGRFVVASPAYCLVQLHDVVTVYM